jgi:hypothetical protein
MEPRHAKYWALVSGSWRFDQVERVAAGPWAGPQRAGPKRSKNAWQVVPIGYDLPPEPRNPPGIRKAAKRIKSQLSR